MFSRINRLAKEGDIVRVLRKGRKFFDPFFTLRMYFSPEVTVPRFAIVVSTKVSKKATRRNRIRRIMRERLRTHVTGIRPGDYLIQVQPRIIQMSEVEQQRAFLELLQKARVIPKQ